MDLVGHSSDQRLQEAGRRQLRSAAIEASEHQLGRAVHGHIEERLPALIAQLRDVDGEVANLVIFERLRLFAIRLAQAGDAVLLKALAGGRLCVGRRAATPFCRWPPPDDRPPVRRDLFRRVWSPVLSPTSKP